MNKELLEKLSAIREDLLAFKALVPDDAKIVVEQGKLLPCENNPHIHKLADLVKQKYPVVWSNYDALRPYMNNDQKSRADWAFGLNASADFYFKRGKDHLTPLVTKRVPLMLADLDDIAKKLENNAAPNPKTGAAI